MKNRVVLYIDDLGQRTIIADQANTEFIIIDERKPEKDRVKQFVSRLASENIIEALMLPWPHLDEAQKTRTEAKKIGHLKLVGSNKPS